VPATADELPVNVNVHTTAPAEFIRGVLKAAVNPFGNPEATLIVDPAADAAVIPPTGVAVTVTVAVERACTETLAGETVSKMPGACCTCATICLLAEMPSPLAVTVIVAEPNAAVDEAVKVSVDEPVSLFSVTGLLLHDAVTPAGKPLTLRLTAPPYVGLPARLNTSVAVAPCTTETVVDAAAIASVGGVSVTVMGKLAVAA